ncbi:uncharacterized protein LOC100570960 [Acyrthosiphon pisum]|uniref:Uncharacterized protein n=1 Tax=Acyrthosiphon pisum TaxID=7029 RepID=A0A8R2A9B4_ACYPI|nr:uncharacterized protein LOC100570960 [Acyrthosiphon pisum]|eukprot:XP_003245999.1 PREDICTED: uncharacterized protein LOC100570960 [Acyrthosiphon pisum]
MYSVQVLVVLSTMVIINQAATLKYENQSSVTASYDTDKMAYEILNNKTYISNGNYSETTSPYYFNVTEFLENVDFSEINSTDIFESINNSNETALPVLKSNFLGSIFRVAGKQAAIEVVSTLGTYFNNLINNK